MVWCILQKTYKNLIILKINLQSKKLYVPGYLLILESNFQQQDGNADYP